VCNEKHGLDINLHDIGRSHIIGKVKDEKSQVIVRFISYRTRNKVYSNKKGLKNQNKLICINRVLDISPFINRHLNVVETKAGTP
jgi:hypothetical protein